MISFIPLILSLFMINTGLSGNFSANDLSAVHPAEQSLSIQSDTVTWDMLAKVKYKRKQHEEYGYVNFPIFPAELKALRGKTIIISGYIIPLDSETYVLSKYVFASCFFCGGAGAETIMGINFQNLKKRLRTDQFVTLKGQLFLNEDDVNDWMFHIDKAEIIKGG
ncbi:MAG: hypothetical protein ACK4GL_06210 [Flavobacteriales bacterium]